jgi:hypothetical protein
MGSQKKSIWKCWEIISDDPMAMFVKFKQGDLPVVQMNFGTIILLPKIEMQFRFNNCLLIVS